MVVGFGKKIVEVASDLTEVQNVVDTAFKDSAGEIEQWSKEAINKFGLSELAAKRYASRIMAMSNSMEISHQNGLILSKNIAQLSADLASFYNTDVESAFESLNAIFTGQIRTLRRYGLNISEANLENYRLSKGIKTAYSAMSEQQKVLLRYNYVMEHTKDIQGDFAKTQITFANQTKLLQQNFKSLAGTLGSFLIPVLSTILRYLNAVIVAINSFFGRLAKIAGVQLQHFGGGVELTDGIADGWDNAAGAAAKYKATIAGFDELETLNPQSSGGGGGAGGGGLSGEDLFPDGLLSYDVDDNTQALDVSFNNLIKLIDDKINEIREKSDTLASTFGKNVNGIINYVNWPLLGQTVGDGFNLVTSAVNRFMEEIDFHNLGEKFASSVNSIFDTVDFEETGHKLSLKFNAIIDTVNGFVGKLDFDSIAAGILTHFKTALAEIKWEQAGETLAMGINKIFGFLDDLLNGNIVADLGTKIGIAINTAVENIDAAQIGRVADGLAKQIIAAIKAIDWGLIGTKLNEAFKESNLIGNLFEAIKTAIGININVKGGIFGGLFNLPPGLGKILYAIGSGVAFLATTALKAAAPIVNLGAKLALFNASINIWHQGIMWLFDKDVRKGQTFFEALSMSAEAHMPTLEILGQMFESLGNKVKLFGTALIHPLASIQKLGTVLGGLFTKIITFIAANPAAQIIAGIALVAAALITLWHNSEEFRDGVLSVWNDYIKPALEEIADAFKDLWENHLEPFWNDSLKPLLQSMAPIIKSVWDTISGIIGTIVLAVGTFVGVVIEVLGKIMPFITSIVGIFVDVVSGVMDILNGIIKFLTGDFSGAWESAWKGISKIVESVFGGLANVLTVPINAIVGIVNNLIGGVRNGIQKIVNWVNNSAVVKAVKEFLHKDIWLPSVPDYRMPYLANGGVIDSPTVAMLGEYANAKSNPEIVAPEAKIAALLNSNSEATLGAVIPLMRQLINAVDNKDFSVSIGDDTIAAAAQRGNKNYQRRTGQPLFGL